MATIRTIIHAYCFNTQKPAENAAYLALCEQLNGHPRKIESWGGKSHYYFVKPIDGRTIELDTEHLFSNQWNTAPIDGAATGLRVFDWAQDYPIDFPKHIKRGHYLEQTAEMRGIRRNTMACGYCGRQEPAQKGHVFCPHCMGSEYLKSTELQLTRMLPVCDSDNTRAPLSAAELEHLMPLYKHAQLHGVTERDKARIAKAAADIVAKRDTAIRNANAEHDGFAWLMAHGIKTDNVIFYSHTFKFSFGWRAAVDAAFLSEFLDIVSEFPFPYEIKCADGRTLSGE